MEEVSGLYVRQFNTFVTSTCRQSGESANSGLRQFVLSCQTAGRTAGLSD